MQSDIEGTVADLEHLYSGLNRLATRARLRRAMHPGLGNLSATDTWLLTHLADVGPTRMSALAEWQDVDRSTITTQVKRLERAGLAVRRADPTDRRASLVSLTREGEEVSRGVRQAAAAFFRDALADWTPAQRRELVDSLTRLSAAMEERLT